MEGITTAGEGDIYARGHGPGAICVRGRPGCGQECGIHREKEGRATAPMCSGESSEGDPVEGITAAGEGAMSARGGMGSQGRCLCSREEAGHRYLHVFDFINRHYAHL